MLRIKSRITSTTPICPTMCIAQLPVMFESFIFVILDFFMRILRFGKVTLCSLFPKMPISSTTNVMAAESKTNTFVRGDKVLIVGLGNYDMPKTRHTVGMQVVDYLASCRGCKWERDRAINGFITEFSDDPRIILLKSKHFMNLNGKSVKRAVTDMDIPIGNIYLVCDELDKAVGKFSIKERGSARGHNGVRSVGNCLQTLDIPRLLIGVDRPSSKNDVASYLLKSFTPEERPVIQKTIPNAAKLLLSHIQNQMGEECEHNLMQLLPT